MISSSCGVSVACLGLISSILIVLSNSYVKRKKSSPKFGGLRTCEGERLQAWRREKAASSRRTAQRQGSCGFGFGFEEVGKFFDGCGLFDDVHGENVRGRGLLEFVAQIGRELEIGRASCRERV